MVFYVIVVTSLMTLHMNKFINIVTLTYFPSSSTFCIQHPNNYAMKYCHR